MTVVNVRPVARAGVRASPAGPICACGTGSWNWGGPPRPGQRRQRRRPSGWPDDPGDLRKSGKRSAELAAAGGIPPAPREPGDLIAAVFPEDRRPRPAAATIQLHGGIGFTWEHDTRLYYENGSRRTRCPAT